MEPEHCLQCAVEALGQARILLEEALKRGSEGWRKVRAAADEAKHAENHLADRYPQHAGKIRAWRKTWSTCMWTEQPPADCLPPRVLEECEDLRDEIMNLSPLKALEKAVGLRGPTPIPVYGEPKEAEKVKEALRLLAETEEGRRLLRQGREKIRHIVVTYLPTLTAGVGATAGPGLAATGLNLSPAAGAGTMYSST